MALTHAFVSAWDAPVEVGEEVLLDEVEDDVEELGVLVEDVEELEEVVLEEVELDVLLVGNEDVLAVLSESPLHALNDTTAAAHAATSPAVRGVRMCLLIPPPCMPAPQRQNRNNRATTAETGPAPSSNSLLEWVSLRSVVQVGVVRPGAGQRGVEPRHH